MTSRDSRTPSDQRVNGWTTTFDCTNFEFKPPTNTARSSHRTTRADRRVTEFAPRQLSELAVSARVVSRERTNVDVQSHRKSSWTVRSYSVDNLAEVGQSRRHKEMAGI